MRPIRLEVEGFTSFRSRATLDFTPLDLFAITGPTGAGKSSLLDAMLFALYGRTPRLGEKNLSELIHQSAQELRVLFEFSAAGEAYRVLRILKRRGAATRRLEKEEGGRWVSVADSAADLKHRIPELTGLDFEGFTRAVILPQGEFDQFLRGDPKQRHEILSRLLHLQVYEAMKQRAFEWSREAEMKAESIGRSLDTVFAGVTEEALAECESRLTEAAVRAREAAARRDEAQRKLRLAREYAVAAALEERRKSAVGELRRSLDEAGCRLAQVRERRIALHDALTEAEARLAAAGFDETVYHRLLALRPVVRQYSALVLETGRLCEQLAGIEQEFGRAQEDSGTKEAAARAAAEETRQALRAHEAASSAADATRKRTALRDLARDWRQREPELRRAASAREGRVQELQARLGAARMRKPDLETQLNDAGSAVREAAVHREHVLRRDAAGALRSGLTPGEPCPVCEQTVTALPPGRALDGALTEAEERWAHHSRMESAARDALRAVEYDLLHLPIQLQESEKALEDARESLAWLRARVEEAVGGPVDERAAEKLDALARQAEEAQRKANEAMNAWRDAAAREADQTHAAQRARHRADLAAQRRVDVTASLHSGLDRKRQIEEQLGDYREATRFEQEWNAAERAREAHSRIRAEIANLIAQRGELDRDAASADTVAAVSGERLRQAEAAFIEARQAAAALQTCLAKTEVQTLEDAAAAAEQEAVRSEEDRRTIESEQHRIRSRLEEAAVLREELAAASRRRKILKQLHEELFANRFPGFVEAATLRTLAAEGSRQFHELSGERYSFDPASSDFDVIDHWHAGERRSAGTLSGGESFLASLSLALALSSSLPRYASRLEALFLDEGFSTLDTATLDEVTSALEKLAGGTRMIGVISHVAELADRLPWRIRVNKSPRGSTLSVEG